MCELIPATTRILCADQQIPFVCLQRGTDRVAPERYAARSLGRAQEARSALLELLHDHPLDAFGLDLGHASKCAGQPATERS
jgi:hypothetical protein